MRQKNAEQWAARDWQAARFFEGQSCKYTFLVLPKLVAAKLASH